MSGICWVFSTYLQFLIGLDAFLHRCMSHNAALTQIRHIGTVPVQHWLSFVQLLEDTHTIQSLALTLPSTCNAAVPWSYLCGITELSSSGLTSIEE